MHAALESFIEVDHPNKLAILGDMLELGDISFKEHQKIVYYLKHHKIQTLLVGKEFGETDHEFPWYENYTQLIENENLDGISNYLILLKGSRGIKLEELIPQL